MATPRLFRHALFVGLAATVTTVAVLPAAVGSADPHRSIAEVQREVDALDAKVDAAVERYNQSRIQLSEASRRTAAAERKVAAERKSIEVQRKAMGQVAVAAYRTGGADEFVSLVTSSDPQSFLDRASSLDQISSHQAGALRGLEVAQLRLAQAQAEARQQLAAQQKIAKELKGQKEEIEASLAAEQRVLDSLEAAERKRLAAAAAARATAARTAAVHAVPHTSYNGPASGRASAALKFAYAQLGKPYQWGAAGPNSYDCSGLTMASWAHAGVSLPHSSSAQYGSGPHVTSLQPGDLVFFGSPIHHVGMYVGNGNYIHAPHTGDVVSIDPLNRSDYVGAVRP